MSLPQPAAAGGNRFALVTPDDNSAPLIITTILSLIFSFLTFAARIFAVKWKTYGADDHVLGVAHIVGVGQWVAVFLALHNGLGKSFNTLEEGELSRMAKALYASRILTTIALSLSKMSVILVIRSLFTWEKKQKMLLIDMSLAFCGLWGLASALTISLGCPPSQGLGPTKRCPNDILRLQVILILDIITECIIVTLPIIFLWALRMSRYKKCLVIFAFSFRLPLAAISLVDLLAVTRFLNSHPTHPGTNLVCPVVWQQILLGYSLMSATIPCLKSFIRGFTHGGVGYLQNATYGDERYQSGSGRSGDSFVMLGLRKKRSAIEAGIEIGAPTAAKNTPQEMYDIEDIPLEGTSIRSHVTGNTQESQREIIGPAT